MLDADADAWVKKLLGKDLERIFSTTDLGQGAHFGKAKKAAKAAAKAAKKAAKAAAKALINKMLKAVIKKVKGLIAKISSGIINVVKKAMKKLLGAFCKGKGRKMFDRKLIKKPDEMAACTNDFTVDGLGSSEQDVIKFNRDVLQMQAELVRRMFAKLLYNWVTVPLKTLSKYMALMKFPKSICKSMPSAIHQAVVKAVSFVWLQLDRLPGCGMHFYDTGGRRRTDKSAWKSSGKGGLQEYRRRDTFGAIGCKKCKYPTEGPTARLKLVPEGNPKEGGPIGWKDFCFPTAPKTSKLWQSFDQYNETKKLISKDAGSTKYTAELKIEFSNIAYAV